MINNNINSYGKSLFWILITVLLLALIRNAIYSHPMADDYCYSTQALNFGNWYGALLNEYKVWGGRYSATTAMSIFALNFELTTYFWLVPLSLITLTVVSFYIFFSSLHHIAGNNKDWLTWGAFSFLIYIATVPALSEIMYWMAGGVTYTTGYGFLLIVLGLLIKLTFSSLSKSIFIAYSSLVLILVFILAGFSEVAALLQILLLLIGAIATISKKNQSRYVWVAALLIAIAGLAIVASAPGNDVRLSRLQGGIKWVTPFYGIYRGVGAILVSSLVMYLLTANNFVAPLTQRLINAFYNQVTKLNSTERILLLICVLGLVSAVFMPSYWAEGGSPAKRTQTILYILPLILWIPVISTVMTFTGLKPIRLPWLNNYRYSGIIFSISLFLIIALSFNIKNIILDNVWRAENYDKQLMKRYEYIEKSKNQGKKNITVPKLTDLPKSMFFADVLTDPTHWRNTCYRDYFGLESIKTDQ